MSIIISLLLGLLCGVVAVVLLTKKTEVLMLTHILIGICLLVCVTAIGVLVSIEGGMIILTGEVAIVTEAVSFGALIGSLLFGLYMWRS